MADLPDDANEARPQKASANELTLKDTQQANPSRLSELTAEFVLCTPAMLVLYGGFDRDPMAYAAGQVQTTDIFEITSPKRLFDLPGHWGVTVWAIPKQIWQPILQSLGRLTLIDKQQQRVATLLYHELDVPDVLDHTITNVQPVVPVQAFAVDANFGYFYLHAEPGKTPRPVLKRPRPATILAAQKLLAVRT